MNIYKGTPAHEFDEQDFENAFPGYDNVKSAKVIHDLFSRKFDALALLKRLEQKAGLTAIEIKFV